MVLVHLEDHMTGPIEQSGSCSQLNSNHNDQPSQNGDHSEECCHCAHGDDHDHHEHVEPCHHDRTGHNHSDNNSTGNNQQEPSPSIAHAPEEPFSRVVGFMDIAGVFASTLCAVHCLLLPFVLVLLPVLAEHLMHYDFVHVGLAGFVLTFCLMAYVPGYLKHRDRRLVWIGVIGITLVFFATFIARYWGEAAEGGIITLGNLFIIFGHLHNRRLLAHLKCKHR